MNRTLFNIGEDFTALMDLLSETGGDVTDEAAESAIEQFFAELGEERDKKLDGYCALIKEFEAISKVRKEEAARLSALASTDDNNAKKLKARLMYFFQSQNLQKIETARFKIARQANGGKTPVSFNEQFQNNPVELPEELRRVVFTPDADALREMLESDDESIREIAGQFGAMGERGEHLRIR